MSDQAIELDFIVNGECVHVTTESHSVLSETVAEALEKSGNVGQSLANWELRDESGTVVDMQSKIEQADIQAGTKCFLNLKAGVGGSLVS